MDAKKPDDVHDATWADYLELRKSKRAKLTETALKGLRREARIAGWNMEAVLTECCMRGWIGFKAAWVCPDVETFRERDARLAADKMSDILPGIAARRRGTIDITQELDLIC